MSTKLRLIPILLAIFIAGVAANAQAAEPKIGVVNLSELMKNSPQAQNAGNDITKKFDGRRKDLIAEQDKIKSKQDDLNKNGPVMTQAQVQEEQNQLDEMQRDLSRKSGDFQDDINMAKNAALSNLQQDVLKAVQEFALAQKYNLIVGEGVLYNDNTVDVTDQVLAQMQKDYKAASAKSGG